MISVGCCDIGKREKLYVNDALNKGMLCNGLYTQRFENTFAHMHGAKYGLMMNSGTDALRIALATLKECERWKDGDQILCPATTFVATANVILQNSLRVKFVDVDRFSYAINPSMIGSLPDSTRAAIPVHLMGLPVSIRAFKERKLKVIEDSCETMGVNILQGDIACFSTYVAHVITTGVGGIAITNNAHYDMVMKSYMNHGRDPKYLGGYFGGQTVGNKYILDQRFRFNRVGYSSRATDLQAALGLAQLERLKGIINQRRRASQAIWDQLIDLSDFIQLPIQLSKSSCMMFPIVVKQGSRSDLCVFLEKNGIETRPLMPLINQPCYKELKINPREFPVASWLNENGFYIGSHQLITNDEIYKIGDTFKKFFSDLSGSRNGSHRRRRRDSGLTGLQSFNGHEKLIGGTGNRVDSLANGDNNTSVFRRDKA